MSPLDRLVREVAEALARYRKTGDHKHGGAPYPGDCIACALYAVVRGYGTANG